MTNDTPSPASDPGTPSAGKVKNVRKEYEAALGEFLIIFNQIENIVSDIFVLALRKAGREKIPAKMMADSFAQKILYLDLISLCFPKAVSRQLIDGLITLGNERNHLAHGHFEGNPFDESYVVVSKQKRLDIPVTKVRQLTKQAEALYEQLRQAQVFFWFEDPIQDGQD